MNKNKYTIASEEQWYYHGETISGRNKDFREWVDVDEAGELYRCKAITKKGIQCKNQATCVDSTGKYSPDWKQWVCLHHEKFSKE